MASVRKPKGEDRFSHRNLYPRERGGHDRGSRTSTAQKASISHTVIREQDMVHVSSPEEIEAAIKALPEGHRDRLLRLAALKHHDVFQDIIQHHTEQLQLQEYIYNFEEARAVTQLALSNLEKGEKDVTAITKVVKEIEAEVGGVRVIALLEFSPSLSRAVKKYALMTLVSILDCLSKRTKSSVLRSVVQKTIKNNKVWSRAVGDIVQHLGVDDCKDALLEGPEINERPQQVVDLVRRKDATRNLRTVLQGISIPENQGLPEIVCKIEHCVDKPKDKQPYHDNIIDLEQSSEEESLQQEDSLKNTLIGIDYTGSTLRRSVTSIGPCSETRMLRERGAIESRRLNRATSDEVHTNSPTEHGTEEIRHFKQENRETYGRQSDNHSSIDFDYHALPDYAPPASSLEGIRIRLLIHGINARNTLDLSHDPDSHLLHLKELKLASVLRLSCAKYLCSKRRIFRGRLYALRVGRDFKKTDAQKVCRIANDKASRLWTAFNNIGWFDEKHFLRYLRTPREAHDINPISSTKDLFRSCLASSSPATSTRSSHSFRPGPVGSQITLSPVDAPPPESPGSEYRPEFYEETPLTARARAPRRTVATSRPYHVCRDRNIKYEGVSVEASLKRELDDSSELELKQQAKRRFSVILPQAQVCVPDSQIMNSSQSGKRKDNQDATPHIKAGREDSEPRNLSGNINRLGRMFFEKKDHEDDSLDLLRSAFQV